MRWGAAARLVAVVVVAAQAASPTAPPPDRAPLVVEPSGCHAVLADGACERPTEGNLRVWVDAEGPLVVRRDGKEVPVSGVRIAGGTRFALDATAGATIEIAASGRRGHLRMATPFVPPWAADAVAARARGDQAAARATARPWLDDPDVATRARAAGLAARAELALGNVSEAIRLLQKASADAALAGRISDAVDDALALSFALAFRTERWTEAGAVIDRIEPVAARYADGRARLPYYRALVASALGDVRAAQRELRIARSRAEALGLERLVWSVRNESARLLERSGRRTEAVTELVALAQIEDPTVTACERADALLNVGFATLMRAQERAGPCAAPPPAADPSSSLRASLTLSEVRCPNAHRTAMAHVHLGDAALDAAQIDEAARELARVDMREASNALRRDTMDLDARIALARGDPRGALARYERLVALARATGKLDDERRAREGAGLALLPMTTKTFRALSAFAFFALALSPLVACTMSDSDEGVGEQTQAASQLREPARTPPPPQDPSTTLAAPTGIAEGIFCTLCEAQGCLCSGDQCIECGQHLTSAPPTRR